MQRVVVVLADQFIFSADIPVRVSDINYVGHVGNDSILTIMQEARVMFYRELGFRDEIHIAPPVGQIVADSAIVYKSESFLGDILKVEIGISGMTRSGFDMIYRISNKDTGKEVAVGKTAIVSFDYEKRKVAAIPDLFRNKLGAL